MASCAFALAAAAFAANMASQKWVEMKIDELRAEIGVTRAISPMAVDAGTNGTIYAFFDPATHPALSVTNSANASITNGALFAWVGSGVYTNSELGAINATQTNFVWNAVGSRVVDGIDTFIVSQGFGVTGTYLTKSQFDEVAGGAR